jgi:transcriptional regulator with XRE-family HTH domain
MQIREARLAARRSLRSVATKLGISHVFLGEIERGIRPLPERLIEPLSQELQMPTPAQGRAPITLRLDGLSEEQRRAVASMVEGMREGTAG